MCRDTQVRDAAVGVGEIAEHWEKHAQSWMSSALNPTLEMDGCRKWEERRWVRSPLTFAEGQGGQDSETLTGVRSGLSCTGFRLALEAQNV